jgi:hypothetical protein
MRLPVKRAKVPPMLTHLLITCILATPSTERLAVYITKRQPRARTYSTQLAQRVVAEGKRHKIRPAVLLAIAWTESRYLIRARGRAREHGLWQIMARDYRLPAAWTRLRGLGWLRGYPVGPWRKLPATVQRRALTSIRVGTALAAAELAGVRAWCRKAGHRIGRGTPRWIRGPDGVHRLTARTHGHWIERFGHHQTGPRWPRGYYVRMLRREYRRISLVLKP